MNHKTPGSMQPTGGHYWSLPFIIHHSSFIIICIICLSLAGCAGYQIGNQTLYPSHIRTVYVPMFESTSFRRNLGERLTEAVMKEIELKTPYKVTGSSDADSVLSGRIVGDTKRQLVTSKGGDPRELQLNLRVEVSWIDRQGSALRPRQAIPLPGEITTVAGTADLVPEVGHSIATSQQLAITRLAEQIVSLMEAPW